MLSSNTSIGSRTAWSRRRQSASFSQEPVSHGVRRLCTSRTPTRKRAHHIIHRFLRLLEHNIEAWLQESAGKRILQLQTRARQYQRARVPVPRPAPRAPRPPTSWSETRDSSDSESERGGVSISRPPDPRGAPAAPRAPKKQAPEPATSPLVPGFSTRTSASGCRAPFRFLVAIGTAPAFGRARVAPDL